MTASYPSRVCLPLPPPTSPHAASHCTSVSFLLSSECPTFLMLLYSFLHKLFISPPSIFNCFPHSTWNIKYFPPRCCWETVLISQSMFNFSPKSHTAVFLFQLPSLVWFALCFIFLTTGLILKTLSLLSSYTFPSHNFWVTDLFKDYNKCTKCNQFVCSFLLSYMSPYAPL